jgi:hypothetical protein
MYDEVSSATVAIEPLDTLTTECDLSIMLCSSLDIDISLPDDRNIDTHINTESCLRWRYTNRIVEIRSISSQSTLLCWYNKCDIEISISIISFMTFTTEFDRHTIIDPFWDIDSFICLGSKFALSMT